jgi:hypothetical protein
MIKTFGEDSYNRGYAFVFNFRDKIAVPSTRTMVANKLISNFGVENDLKAEKFIAKSSIYILCNGL